MKATPPIPDSGQDKGIDMRWRVMFSLRVTALSIAGSLLVYAAISFLISMPLEGVGLTMSVVVPLLVAPMATFVTSGFMRASTG